MDNDIKIEEKQITPAQRHKDVLLFLNKELDSLQMNAGSGNTYNLEHEYAKTRKNRSPFVPLVIIGCFLITLGIAWFLSYRITKQNQSVEVNLEEFDSLNLKTLLDSVTKVQDKYDNAVKKRDQAVSQMESELKQLENKKEDELFVLASLSKVDGVSAAKRQAIIDEYETKVAAVRAQYEEKIAELEVEIQDYKTELATYDSSKVESAKALEQAVSSERSVQELEKKRLVETYENRIAQLEADVEAFTSDKSVRSAVEQVTKKYSGEIEKLDPVVKDEQAKAIVNDYRYKITKTYDAVNYQEMWQEDEALSANLQQYQDLYTKYKYLRKFVASVPQKNSIPGLVNTTNKLVDEMSETYISSIEVLQNQKNELLAQIEALNLQMEELELQHQEEIAAMLNKNELERGALEQYYARVNYNYKDCINQLVNTADQSGVVVYATSKDSVVVFVVPRYRYLITPAGTLVEIEGVHKVSGRLIPYGDDGFYKFVSDVDENGNEVDYNLRDITPGSFVKFVSVE